MSENLDNRPERSAPAPRRGAPDGGRRRSPLLPIIVLVLALGLAGGFLVDRWMNRDADTHSGDVPVYTPTPSATSASTSATSPKPSPTRIASQVRPSSPPAKVDPGCMSTATEIEPTRFVIEDIKVDSPMLSLGTDSSGAAAAPPKNASHTVGWWNKGPKVGSDKGNVVLTIHTYRQGGALGNQLNSDKGIKPGMVVRMTDAQGKTMCYKYERALKIWVKDYDPNSTVLYNNNGKPQAVIVICWDFNRGTEEWDSRILYYLTPLV
ncbi:class F sortase [Aestuariimicrobium ganziense]|uniref:class F sortase n=1 Tax=Aestuariimicrobium ganziense TaxID=2773677 RepID=UPI001F2E54E5|nr:class F sortase [Aestuariimicrobium ganziense]